MEITTRPQWITFNSGRNACQSTILSRRGNGSRTDSEAGSGVSESTSWWTSTDGVDWNEIDDLPDEPTAVHLEAVGGALWVETFQNWPDRGVTQSLSRWDGSEFAPLPLPPPGTKIVVTPYRTNWARAPSRSACVWGTR